MAWCAFLVLSLLSLSYSLESDFQEIQVEKDPRLSAREVDHHFCMTNADDYRTLYERAQSQRCSTSYSVLVNLERMRVHRYPCLQLLIQQISSLHSEKCTCAASHGFRFDFVSIDNGHYHDCIKNSVYRHAVNLFLTHQPHDTGYSSPQNVHCQANAQIWDSLHDLLHSSSICFRDFIRHMYVSFKHHGEPPCHNKCQSQSAGSQSTISPSPTTVQMYGHHYSSTELYHAYETGVCLSEHTVWSFLHNHLPSGMSQADVINHMADIYPHGTDSKCACTKRFDLQFHWLHHDIVDNCLKDHMFSGTFYHLQNTHHHHVTQNCHSHMSVWKDLKILLDHLDHRNDRCVDNLVNHLLVSLQDRGDPCSCHQVISTTTTKAPTSSTSSPGPMHHCSKIKTVEALAEFQQMYPQIGQDCSGQRSASDLITTDLCGFNVTSQNWRPGSKVSDFCDVTSNLYSAVATFRNGGYPSDGLAGVYVGCNATSVKIATQECGGKFEIVEIPRNPSPTDTFTHSISNYYAITF